MYEFFFAVYAIGAAVYTFAPLQAAKKLFGDAGVPVSYLQKPLFRMFAIGIATASLVLLIQKVAEDHGKLGDDAHRRLNASICLFAAANLGLQAVLIATNPIMKIQSGVPFGLIAATTCWIAGRNFATYSPEGGNPLAILQSYVKDVSSLGNNVGAVSALYAALTAGFIGAGFAYLFAPLTTLNAVFGRTVGKGVVDVALWQRIGGALITLVAPIAFAEREAANNNNFSHPTNRMLNAGLAIASVSHVAILLPLIRSGLAGPLAPALTSFWGLAGITSGLIAAFPK